MNDFRPEHLREMKFYLTTIEMILHLTHGALIYPMISLSKFWKYHPVIKCFLKYIRNYTGQLLTPWNKQNCSFSVMGWVDDIFP